MKMADYSNLTFNQQLFRWRWSIAALISIFVFAFEVAIRHQTLMATNPKAYYLEVLFFAITLPLLFGITVSMLRTRSELVHTITQYDHLRGTRQHLNNAGDWDELATILLQIPRAMLPLVGDALMIYNQKTGFTSAWPAGVEPGGAYQPDSFGDPRNLHALHVKTSETPIICLPCCCLQADGLSSPSKIYCHPLGHDRQWSGLLILYLEPGFTPEPDQIQPLIELSSDIDLNIERFQLRQIVVGEASAAKAERQRVAHYLHDTLAHNVAFYA
jgi:signal transduction histidine kinase